MVTVPVVMFVSVMTALAVFAVMFVSVMTALTVFVVMTVSVMTALTVFVVMFMFFRKLSEFAFKRLQMFHSRKNFFAAELVPRRRNDSSFGIVFTHKLISRFQLVCTCFIGVTEHYTRRGFYLVVKKFAEVFHIHFTFRCIDHRCISVYFAVGKISSFNRADYVGKFTDTRRFDNDSFGVIIVINLFKSFCKIADKRTAYTTRIELVYLNSRIL